MEHRAELEAVAKELDEPNEIIILVHSDVASALSCLLVHSHAMREHLQ